MQLLPQSLPGVMMYYKNGTINLPTILISMFVVIGSLVGIYFGAFLVHNNFVNLKAMYGALSFLLIGSGLYIIRTYLMDDKKILEEEAVLMDEKSV
tara:strand:- start:446 stop:733 length:288 start_codon:yes stop_codon:yes gene_type:complete